MAADGCDLASPPAILEHALAKINLYLHVTGQRADGYHDLDTLTVFASFADTVLVQASGRQSEISNPDPVDLNIIGPFAEHIPQGEDNLVCRVAGLLQAHASNCRRSALPVARITLTKRIPAASGVGGGSADAAAAIRALNRFWGLNLSLECASALTSVLGSDIPMCLRSEALLASGTGDQIRAIPNLPSIPAVLVNPAIGLETPAVFSALNNKNNKRAAKLPGKKLDLAGLTGYLKNCRNDLEKPAITLVPEISAVLKAFQGLPGCMLARMSGSGATCYAIFADQTSAGHAAKKIASTHPDWWVQATELNNVS